MTKKRSKSLFVLFSILLVVCLFFCFVNFTYPFAIKGNYYSYSNFVANLKLGEDVSSSLKIVYRAEMHDENEIDSNYNELRTSTMRALKDIVEAEGYRDVYVAEHGTDGIVIQIGNLLSVEDKNSVEGLIGNPASISFSTETDGSNPFATAKHIKSVEALQSNNSETGEVYYVVALEFESQYVNMISSASSGKTVYIYLGETQFASLDYSGSEISGGIIYLQSSSFKSMLDATSCANQIKAGMLDLSLTKLTRDYASATYGENVTLLLTISMAVLVVAAFVYLILKFKDMGWLSCFALLFFTTISLFLLQSIPLVHINFAGMIAMMLCFWLAVDNILTILEKAKENYQSGAQLFISVREAQKATLAKTLFFNALVIVSGCVCLFMPVAAIRSFGWVALVMGVVSMFTTQALMRLFTKMYLTLNSENGAKCNFHKGGKNA